MGGTQNKPKWNQTIARQTRSNYKCKYPKNEKELKIFLEAIQYFSKYMKIYKAQPDKLRKFLRKQYEWKWTDEYTKAFNNPKNPITGTGTFPFTYLW